MRRLLLFTTALAVALLLGPPTQVFAGTITFSGNYTSASGTGFGSIDNVLTLHATGPSTPTQESGAVSWDGSAPDVLSGDATNTSQTLTAAYRTSAAGTNISWSPVTGADFAVVFQVNQTGSNLTVDLNQFQIDFFTAAGGSIPGITAVYTEVGNQTSALPGVGVGSSGWLFNVHLDGAEALAFFGTPTNRLGMSVPGSNPIGNFNDGPENFYIAAGQSVSVVPEPASMASRVSALSLLGYGRGGWSPSGA
jgi:hypothetical protein